jgi:cyclic beta-1,2-glucan synthetase
LLDLRTRFGRSGQAQKCAGDEPPLRSEPFSSDQMMRHGKALADAHQLGYGGVADRPLARLADNESILIESRRLLTEAVQDNNRITPAGEWLIGGIRGRPLVYCY